MKKDFLHWLREKILNIKSDTSNFEKVDRLAVSYKFSHQTNNCTVFDPVLENESSSLKSQDICLDGNLNELIISLNDKFQKEKMKSLKK